MAEASEMPAQDGLWGGVQGHEPAGAGSSAPSVLPEYCPGDRKQNQGQADSAAT